MSFRNVKLSLSLSIFSSLIDVSIECLVILKCFTTMLLRLFLRFPRFKPQHYLESAARCLAQGYPETYRFTASSFIPQNKVSAFRMEALFYPRPR